MKSKKLKYNLLIHCGIPQMREGFEANLQKLPFAVETQYANLTHDGIVSKLKCKPHLIVVLQYEGDADFLLPLKIKLFAHNCPILVISPAMPDNYYCFLRLLGVEHIIQLPAGDELIGDKIIGILQVALHGKP